MTEGKVCNDCGLFKNWDEFAKNSSRQDGYHNMCKPCKNAYNAQYYIRTKQIHNPARAEARKLHRRENQQQMLAYLAEHPCVDCGEVDPTVLQFDHQRDKLADVSALMNNGMAWASIMVEIEKCEVVCANDHQRRTAKQFGWYKLLKH